MVIRLAFLKCLILCVISIFVLSACETVEKSRFSNKRDDKKAVETYIQLGYNYIAEGNTERGRVSLLKALELDENASEAHALLAYTFQLDAETAIADKHYKRAIKSNPKDAKSRSLYANFLYQEKRYKEAADNLEVILEDEYYPSRAQVFENLGFCYVQLNMNDKAVAAFIRAFAINDQLPRATLSLATIYYEAKNIKESKYYYTRYSKLVSLRRAEETPQSLWLGVSIANSSGDKNTAASLGLRLKNYFPDSVEYKKYKETL